MPLLAHPMPVGTEKQENDLAMKRLRLMPIPKRIEAAVLQNKPWCVEELYLQGCPPDEPNRMGYRPLHLAASYNYQECVKVTTMDWLWVLVVVVVVVVVLLLLLRRRRRRLLLRLVTVVVVLSVCHS